MKERVIWYEPHPVSRERKRELLAQGYRIIDARYAPDGWQPSETPSENGNQSDKQPDKPDWKKLNTDELKAALTERGIAFDARAKKADLLALLEQADE